MHTLRASTELHTVSASSVLPHSLCYLTNKPFLAVYCQVVVALLELRMRHLLRCNISAAINSEIRAMRVAPVYRYSTTGRCRLHRCQTFWWCRRSLKDARLRLGCARLLRITDSSIASAPPQTRLAWTAGTARMHRI